MRTILAVVAFLLVALAQAAEPCRRQLSLDGPWEFRLDPKNESVAARHLG